MFARAHKENTMVGQLIQTRHTHDQTQLQNLKTVNHPDEQEKKAMKAMATLHARQRHKKTIRKLCREFTLKFTRLTKAGLYADLCQFKSISVQRNYKFFIFVVSLFLRYKSCIRRQVGSFFFENDQKRCNQGQPNLTRSD